VRALFSRLGRRFRDDRGAQLLEFAFAFPVVLLATAGVIDVGILIKDYQVVTNAAREGARIGAVHGAALATVTARVNAYLGAGGLAGTATTDVRNVLVANPSGSSVPAVQVTVLYPYEYLVLAPLAALFDGGATPSAVTLRAQATMRQETVTAP
jgi:Flp pilus assembly protein TadG